MPSTYKKAGVDIDAGEEVVRRIKKNVRSSFTQNVLADIGSFGAFYRASFPSVREPVLVSSVDGVGTKLKIAFAMEKFDTVGQDLVNHCVNDIGVCGAMPLYFMDYFATGKLSPSVAEQVISGFVKACKENQCSLIGGETAEMPGFYPAGEFDIAGMIVGLVARKKIVDGKKVQKGDVLVALPSTGLHTNGYSLARHVLLKKYSVKKRIAELGTTLGDALLAVHRSYRLPISLLINKKMVNGMSHITGGGIVGNTNRILSPGLHLEVDWSSWDRPPLFSLIQKTGKVPEEDMRRAFNLGIGFIAIVSPQKTESVMTLLRDNDENPLIIGKIG